MKYAHWQNPAHLGVRTGTTDASASALLALRPHGHGFGTVDATHMDQIAKGSSLVEPFHQIELGRIRLQPPLRHTLLHKVRKVRIRMDKNLIPIDTNHMKRNGNRHHIAALIAQRIRHPRLGRNVAVARTINDDFGVHCVGPVPVVTFSAFNARAVECRSESGNVQPGFHVCLFPHFEHCQSGYLMVVNDLGSKVLKRTGAHLRGGWIRRLKPRCHLCDQSTDDLINGKGTAPEHSRQTAITPRISLVAAGKTTFSSCRPAATAAPKPGVPLQ